jgi:acetoin utilization protein AcuB
MMEMLVRSWMAHNVVSITSDCLLAEAYHLMRDHGVRHLPVLDDGRLIGLVSWGDIRRASAIDARALTARDPQPALIEECPVSEIMSRNPIAVRPDTPMVQAAQIMFEQAIGCLPVIESGRLTGIVTECDIFRMMILCQAV